MQYMNSELNLIALVFDRLLRVEVKYKSCCVTSIFCIASLNLALGTQFTPGGILIGFEVNFLQPRAR